MKKFFKENWKFLSLVLLCGLIGGYCIGLYTNGYECELYQYLIQNDE